MALLAFTLECAAIAAFLGTGVSLLASGTFLVAKPLAQSWRPARRADFAFLLGMMPAIVTIAVVTAAAAPSVLGVLGLANDHCLSHQHHVHLCIVHSSGLRPVLATVGAFSLAVFLFRAVALGKRAVETNKRLLLLERLGVREERRFPIVSLPGGPRLCHAVGILRRRILVSADLLVAIKRDELRAALAHEEAHLHRRDPAALFGLSVAGLFAVPGIAQFLQSEFQEAVEEACDAEAAVAVADSPLVAAALLKVAALQRRTPELGAVAPAFGESSLERRVHLLLRENDPQISPARALLLASVGATLGLALALSLAPHLHHAVETALHQFF